MLKLMTFLHDYMIQLFLLLIFFVFFSWSIGYYSNALFGTHFELQSCWAGLATVGSAGFIGMLKYLIDSWLNSEQGKPLGR